MKPSHRSTLATLTVGVTPARQSLAQHREEVNVTARQRSESMRGLTDTLFVNARDKRSEVEQTATISHSPRLMASTRWSACATVRARALPGSDPRAAGCAACPPPLTR